MTPTPPSPPNRPLWVRAVLSGARRRSTARTCVWISLFLAVGCGVASLFNPRIAVGVIFFMISAILYDRATVWVDRHGGWPNGGGR